MLRCLWLYVVFTQQVYLQKSLFETDWTAQICLCVCVWLGLWANGVTDGIPLHLLEAVLGINVMAILFFNESFAGSFIRWWDLPLGPAPRRLLTAPRLRTENASRPKWTFSPFLEGRAKRRATAENLRKLWMPLDDDPEDFVLHRFLSSIQVLGSYRSNIWMRFEVILVFARFYGLDF